jgi:phosphatidylserine/phosphatidylglycerophosphate/cardiolipin synthase-like enzyme
MRGSSQSLVVVIVAAISGAFGWVQGSGHGGAQTPLAPGPAATVAQMPAVSTWFSPKGGCTEAVVAEIRSAKRSILVQAYSFTSEAICSALETKHRSGVAVRVIVDRKGNSDGERTQADWLSGQGVEVLTDGQHAIAHNKVMIIDDAVVITGSFNFTAAAEHSNAENLLVIRDPTLAAAYARNWQQHLAHSQPWGAEPEAGDGKRRRKP